MKNTHQPPPLFSLPNSGRPHLKASVKVFANNHRPGFSLIELMVVAGIIGLVLLITVPAYLKILPNLETRTNAKTIMATLQKARLTAVNSQKPTRVF
ncbi:MAG: pilus assembly FimT family protein, partial [Candidatus Adiutrix sp.]